MADYLLAHDRARFESLRPVLADAWRRRTFQGCSPHWMPWRASARDYAQQYHLDAQEILLLGMEPTTPFSSALWRALVGELLVVTAEEMPELPSHLESLVRLLPETLAREALEGCGDLLFGRVPYRPGLACFNSIEDNRRLLAELRSIDPTSWTASMVSGDWMEEGDANDELAYSRDGFGVILDFYERAVRADRILVFETLHG